MAKCTIIADYHAYENLWHSTRTKNYTVFGIKQCKDGLVALSLEYGVSDNTYEIVIGGADNSHTSIRASILDSDFKASAQTPGILSCDETRYFWVSVKTV